MKYIYVFVLILSAANTFAQTRRELQKQQEKIVKQVTDSIYLRDDYKKLQAQLEALNIKTNSYTASSIATFSFVNSSISNFNNSIAANGYAGLAENSFRIGLFGSTAKNDKIVVDFMLMNIGFGNKTTAGNNTIRYAVSDFFATNIGYTIIDTKKFMLYPFVGAGLRLANLNYSSPIQLNNTSTNITNIVANNTSISTTNIGVIYQAGVAMDILLREPKQKRRGMLLNIHAAHTGHLGRNIFRNPERNVDYQPQLAYGNFVVGVGLKIFSRK